MCISSGMAILCYHVCSTSERPAREVNAQSWALQGLLEKASTKELRQMLKERELPEVGTSKEEKISLLQTAFLQEKTVLQGLEPMRWALLLSLSSLRFREYTCFLLLGGCL